MEPRSFKRGNHGKLQIKSDSTPSFNGATLIQAWKLTGRKLFVNSPGTLQWSHAHSSVETETVDSQRRAGLCRFNGATLIQAWKRDDCGRGNCPVYEASMEPRSFKRGNGSGDRNE